MKTFKKILCAVDLSQHSDEVASYAIALAKAFQAEVIAVYAAPDLAQYVGLHVPPTSLENTVKEIVAGAEKSMHDFIAATFTDVPATGMVVHGYAAEEILATAAKLGVDLIVMGTHGRKGLDRILFGSVAERVVKNACVPVMTVHPHLKE